MRQEAVTTKTIPQATRDVMATRGSILPLDMYTRPEEPDWDAVDMMSQDAAKNIVVNMFGSQKAEFRRMLGEFQSGLSAAYKDTDQQMSEHIESLRLSEEVMDDLFVAWMEDSDVSDEEL